jgi:hypothetical protein
MTSTAINCRYPFLAKDLQEITDPQVYYAALSGMSGGFFPLGANGFPHGGIHFGDATAGKLNQASGVRCILDGDVVAYRLNTSYPQLNYSNGRKAAYSTGFVLVRHRLTLPPAPKAAGATAPASADVQDIYSLYMHQASWSEYLADGDLRRPAYWKGSGAFRVGKKNQQDSPAVGPQGWGALGSFVSSAPDLKGSKAGKHVGFLPEGSEVLIGEVKGKWGHIKQIVSGGMISPVAGGAFGSDDMNTPWEIPEWRPQEPHGTTTTPGDWGWLYLPDQKSVIEPDPQYLDRVVILAQPYPVKAGSLLGHIGEYQRFREGSPLPPTPRRALLHMEVFAGDGFAEFLTTCRSRAAQLPVDQRSLLIISPATRLVGGPAPSDQVLSAGLRVEVSATSPARGIWAKVQTRKPDAHAQGGFGPLNSAIWIERSKLGSPSAGLPAWTGFPMRVTDSKDPANGFSLVLARTQLEGLDERSKAIDDQGVHWWRVSFGTKEGESRFGWVCEKGHPGTQWQSPWAWPGFTTVDATGISVVDCFKRNLSVLGATDFEEQQQFKPSAASVNNSELMLALEQAIDAQGNRDGTVTAAELQNALKKPWLAQSLSHLVLRYESEWGGSMSRWEALTPLMKDSKPTWVGELARIKKLQWWDQVASNVAGFPKSPTVFHIHPIGLVGNFLGNETEKSLSVNGLWFIYSHEALAGVSNRLHWPKGASGVTLGPGYDMKEREVIDIFKDMKAIGLSDSQARAISLGAKLTKQKAEDFATDNRKIVDLSDDQQVQLLLHVVKPYVQIVRKKITVSLKQHEFDALVSFAYNPAGRWQSVSSFINHGQINSAMDKISKGNTSAGVVMRGLTIRRADEINLYKNASYNHDGHPIPVR